MWGTVRRQPSASQRESPQQNQTTLALWSRTSSLQNCEENIQLHRQWFFAMEACYGLMPVLPTNSSVEILTPKDDGNGNWACGRYLNHRSGALMSEISEAYKRGSREIPSLFTTWGPKTSTNQKSTAPTTLAPWSWDFYLQNCEK